MIKLHAQPYDISANGFYFDEAEGFKEKAAANRNDYGDIVEEYEIQFIDGDRIDCELANAFQINQANFVQFLECADVWTEDEKQRFIIAVGECGYSFDVSKDDINDLEVDIYCVNSLRELAEQFVDDGLFGDIPKVLENYIDLEAIGRDLGMDYAMTDIAGERMAYRCA